MKFLLSFITRFFILLFFGLLGYVSYESYSGKSELTTFLINNIETFSEEVLYEKTIQVKGLELLNEIDIEAFLPVDKSVIWWLFNRSKIETEIETQSLVADAKVNRCQWWKFACFYLEIKERIPMFIALSDKNAWVVADDGAFITPLHPSKIERAMFKRATGEYVKPAIVKGLFTEENSPEVSLARSKYINTAILKIEKETSKSIERVSIRDNGELEVIFRGSSYLVVFDKSYGEEGKLSDQIFRFNKIIEQFKDRERVLASIDLAFNALAVVRLKKG
ncbi:MAG: FtsQ-type POTRA domain-containing protein, partial [Bdellovibrionales bacterium]|nr:FtsQ-type POTRA domain-containing protein [Bdellovibrionales bacterium]